MELRPSETVFCVFQTACSPAALEAGAARGDNPALPVLTKRRQTPRRQCRACGAATHAASTLRQHIFRRPLRLYHV
ncbi:nitroreductase [Neisseria bacilliformis ATCC BAA-1200]|uniref:Nitroreductase n=1 Tax=Neisseria bacilliformis ATCC BAA-1200 TaxID=888742 RepID=F2BE42_9NEIS|nr:nitroreductase [Neisseria bacilliformis ATCC BAA-1200]